MVPQCTNQPARMGTCKLQNTYETIGMFCRSNASSSITGEDKRAERNSSASSVDTPSLAGNCVEFVVVFDREDDDLSWRCC